MTPARARDTRRPRDRRRRTEASSGGAPTGRDGTKAPATEQMPRRGRLRPAIPARRAGEPQRSGRTEDAGTQAAQTMRPQPPHHPPGQATPHSHGRVGGWGKPTAKRRDGRRRNTSRTSHATASTPPRRQDKPRPTTTGGRESRRTAAGQKAPEHKPHKRCSHRHPATPPGQATPHSHGRAAGEKPTAKRRDGRHRSTSRTSHATASTPPPATASRAPRSRAGGWESRRAAAGRKASERKPHKRCGRRHPATPRRQAASHSHGRAGGGNPPRSGGTEGAPPGQEQLGAKAGASPGGPRPKGRPRQMTARHNAITITDLAP